MGEQRGVARAPPGQRPLPMRVPEAPRVQRAAVPRTVPGCCRCQGQSPCLQRQRHVYPRGPDGLAGRRSPSPGLLQRTGVRPLDPSLASSTSLHVLPSLFASAAPCQAATRCAVTPWWDFLLRVLLPAHPFCHCHRRVVILENRDTVISLS